MGLECSPDYAQEVMEIFSVISPMQKSISMILVPFPIPGMTTCSSCSVY